MASMRSNRKVLTVPNGGLGNQLFQVAAGLHLSEDNSVSLVQNLGHPRLNSESMPIVCDFRASNIEVSQDFRFRCLRKISNFLLSLGQNSQKSKSMQLILRLARVMMSLLLSAARIKQIGVQIGIGLGFSSIERRKRTSLLIGYFQTYKFASKPRVFSQLFDFGPGRIGPDLLAYRELAIKEQPLMVHVRLGDYLAEEKFGVLPQSYFHKAIESFAEENSAIKIWVFSDDLEMARSYFDSDMQAAIRWIPEIDSSPVSTLELMRHGSGYVISNSTFSWWGAFLSYDRKARVIAPYPWFAHMESPTDLIPPIWEKINPWGLRNEY
jgi:hypothetical protein